MILLPLSASPSPLTHLVSELSSKITKLLVPSGRALQLFSEDIKGDTFFKFRNRVWEKAQTGEPWVLAKRSWDKFFDAWGSGNGKEGSGPPREPGDP